MTEQPQWEPTAPVPPAFDHIEPQTPTPRSNDMPNLSREDMDPGHDDPDAPEVDGSGYTKGRALPDDQIEHPDEGSGCPITVEAIKDAIAQRVNDAALRLDALRKDRDLFNRDVKIGRAALEGQIKASVTELAEAKRIANALAPRKPRAKKAAK